MQDMGNTGSTGNTGGGRPRRNLRVQGRRGAPAELLRNRQWERLPGSFETNGEAIRTARAKRLWTQQMLGDKMAMSPSSVGHLEKGYYYCNQAFAEHLAVVLTGDKATWTRFVLLDAEGAA